MRPVRIILLALGSLLALVGLGMVIAGLVLGWFYGTQRDDDGFFTTSTERFASSAPAITTEGVEILVEPDAPGWFVDRLGDVRLRAASPSTAVFLGIGPQDEVEAYLAGVARDEIADVDYSPFRVEYRRFDGEAQPLPPGEQTFWAVQAGGTGTQEVTWEIEDGDWIAVLMNADGSAGVQADIQAAARSDLVPGAIAALLGGGALFLLGGGALVLIGAISLAPEPAPAAAPGTAVPGVSPVRLEGRLDEPLSRGLWLVKWLLALPHFFLLAFLWIAAFVLTVFAGFAILFTGRYPRGIFDFNVGVMRWTWRAGYYATSAIATDRYPPFTLRPVPDYPATLEVEYPERLSRGLVLVKWWLLAIPHYLVVAALVSGPVILWETTDQGGDWEGRGVGLLFILVVIAGVSLLFRGRYPQGLFDLVMGINRWAVRVGAYAGLMTDVYPPFRLDQGGAEPPPRAPEPTFADV